MNQCPNSWSEQHLWDCRDFYLRLQNLHESPQTNLAYVSNHSSGFSKIHALFMGCFCLINMQMYPNPRAILMLFGGKCHNVLKLTESDETFVSVLALWSSRFSTSHPRLQFLGAVGGFGGWTWFCVAFVYGNITDLFIFFSDFTLNLKWKEIGM